MKRIQTDLQHLQKKLFREKQQYSILLDKYEKLQSFKSTENSSQLVVDTSQQENHDKGEELQTSRSLDEDSITELTKLQLKMEDVSDSLDKAEVIRKFWMEQVQGCCICKCTDYAYKNQTHTVHTSF